MNFDRQHPSTSEKSDIELLFVVSYLSIFCAVEVFFLVNLKRAGKIRQVAVFSLQARHTALPPKQSSYTTNHAMLGKAENVLHYNIHLFLTEKRRFLLH